MKLPRALTAATACLLICFAFTAASAQASHVPKPPKPKDYTYCVLGGQESECFEPPVEVFRKTHTWNFETTFGTYTQHGRSYDFKETNGPDELIGTRGRHGIISGTLYENGKPTEFAFTLTPR